MRRTSRLIVQAAATAAATAVLLTGCSQSAAEVVTAAFERLETESFRMESVMEYSGETLTSEMRTQAVIDSAGMRGETSTTSTLRVGEGPPETQSATLIRDGDVVYRQPQAAEVEQLGIAADQWLRSEASDTQGIQVVWAGAGPLDVPPEVTEVGQDRVRGDATTHYQFEVRAEELLGEWSESVRDLSRSIPDPGGGSNPEDGLEEYLDSPVTFDVWVDDAGRLRKVRREGGGGYPGSASAVRVTAELWDHGVEVSVEAPPEDQVIDDPWID